MSAFPLPCSEGFKSGATRAETTLRRVFNWLSRSAAGSRANHRVADTTKHTGVSAARRFCCSRQAPSAIARPMAETIRRA